MEKVMSVEERIRRAEDIYNRRNGIHTKIEPRVATTAKKKKGTAKRLFMQMFVCLLIYVIFYAVTNREYVFSKEFRDEVTSFFTEKTKIAEWYTEVKDFISSKFNSNDKASETKEEKKDSEKDNIVQNSTEQNATGKENFGENIVVGLAEAKKDENIGGATEENKTEEKKGESKEQQLTEQQKMEKESKEIKEKINFILPIKGRISSTFGWRNPTTETVPKYHTGIDIAAKEGTIIKSATDGKVIMASSKGDYGNHYQIQIKDIIIVYAHCKKLYLKEGDIVKQGQEIAEVGSTGNSTGPHLHFEIRKGNNKIDPQLILNF